MSSVIFLCHELCRLDCKPLRSRSEEQQYRNCGKYVFYELEVWKLSGVHKVQKENEEEVF